MCPSGVCEGVATSIETKEEFTSFLVKGDRMFLFDIKEGYRKF